MSTSKNNPTTNALGRAISNVLSAAIASLIAYFIVNHYGWAGYGRFSLYSSLIVFAISFVINLLVAFWEETT